MKMKLTLLMASLMAIAARAQVSDIQPDFGSPGTTEDTTAVTTVAGIINEQQEIASRNSTIKHFADVWERKSYINLMYNMTTLTPKEDIPTGVAYNGGIAPEFKSDWGIGIQVGRNYKLHKKPIANMLMFNLDYTYVDLNVSHFKTEGDGRNLYDSSIKNHFGEAEADTAYYMPWNLQKYELTYGMSVGPSLTIAPFTHTNSRSLHFLKLNVFYHIGYHASLLYIVNDEKADANPHQDDKTDLQKDYEKLKDNLKLSLGHGLTHAFGVSLSWKVIGLGYEYCSASKKHKVLSKSDFGGVEYKYSSNSSRLYIQFRM